MEFEHDFFADRDADSRLIIDTVEPSEEPIAISFLVPTFRRVETLGSALNSIYSLTDLDTIEYEVIVIDNSADFSEENKTKALLMSRGDKRLRYFINERNLGMEGNWNRGIWLAGGKLISILHDDDLLAPCYLQALKKALKKVKNIDKLGFIKMDYVIFRDENNLPELSARVVNVEKCRLIETALEGTGPTCTPSCGIVFNREAAIKIGGFNPKLYPAADFLIGIDIISSGYLGYKTREQFSYYRIGVNESMKLATIKKFVINETYIREKLYSHLWYGKIYRFLFERAMYSDRVDFWIAYSKKHFNNPIDVAELDYLGKYRHSPVTMSVIRILLTIYRIFAFHIRRLLKI